MIHPLYFKMCEKIAGYPARWSNDRFVSHAIRWLTEHHGWLMVVKDEWDDEGINVINGWTIKIASDQLSKEMIVCCGETLTEALISAVDLTEIEAEIAE